MNDIASTLPVKHVGITVDAAGTIHVKPDPVVVTTHDALIVFSLGTDGYAFPDTNAVVVTVPHSDFPYAAWTVKPQEAAILDLGNTVGEYEYTVNVVDTATGKVHTLDPIIKNGNPGCA